MFDAKKVKVDCIKWIKDWFDENGKGCNAVIGISGGKDSMLMALCFKHLQKYSKFKFDVKYIVMDPGYAEPNRKLIEANLKTLEVSEEEINEAKIIIERKLLV